MSWLKWLSPLNTNISPWYRKGHQHPATSMQPNKTAGISRQKKPYLQKIFFLMQTTLIIDISQSCVWVGITILCPKGQKQFSWYFLFKHLLVSHGMNCACSYSILKHLDILEILCSACLFHDHYIFCVSDCRIFGIDPVIYYVSCPFTTSTIPNTRGHQNMLTYPQRDRVARMLSCKVQCTTERKCKNLSYPLNLVSSHAHLCMCITVWALSTRSQAVSHFTTTIPKESPSTTTEIQQLCGGRYNCLISV